MDRSMIRVAGMAAILAGLAAAAVAETPPADFRGRQFVDSHGCVFQRTTLSGQVLWLPLTDAADGPVCGQKPSLATAATPQPAAPQPAVQPPAAAPQATAPAKPAVAAPAPKPPPPAAGARWVQAGAYAQPENARQVVKSLQALGFSAGLVAVKGGSLTAVVVGPFATPSDLTEALDRVRRAGFSSAFAR